MKALIGMLLTVALATDFGTEANAQECQANKRVVKHKTESSQLAMKSNRRKCVCKTTAKRSRNVSEMKSRSYSGFRPNVDTIGNGGNLNAPTESGSMNNEIINNNFEDTAIHYPSNGYDSPGFHKSIGSPREGR